MRRWTMLTLLIAAGAGAGYSVLTANPRQARAHRGAPSSRRPHRRERASRPPPPTATPAAERRASAPGPRPLARVPVAPATPQPCVTLVRPDRDGRWVSRDDVLPALGFVDGDDLLTLVNRSPRFVLAPDYVPRDLIEIDTGLPLAPEQCVPPHHQCLRREAAESLRLMLTTMAEAGFEGHVHSSYRSFATQCGVFRKWSYGEGEGFCNATTSSAIAGHSQHQLGTAIDLFTREWMRTYNNVMRPGFGCTPAGRWIAAHSWEFGYVLPYPMPLAERAPGSDCQRRDHGDDAIDPRTGYRYEPWHLRYIGVDAAARFHRAWLASRPGGPEEVTLEQWIRRERGLDADVDLPVCDGCSCGLCTSFHDGAPPAAQSGARSGGEPPRPTGPCGDRALLVGPDGEPAASPAPPRVTLAQARREFMGVRVLVTVSVPARTVTQTPVTSRYAGVYGPDASYRALAPAPRLARLARAYPDLRGAWRLALAPRGGDAWPWRSALRDTSTPAWVNGANMRLPAPQGVAHIEVVVPPVGDAVRVALMRDGAVQGEVLTVPIR